jgi:hypothetical protein
MLKHVGKMKHNGAKVCVIYRTLPGDAFGALVVGTASLPELHHNALMTELESPLGQQANEFGDHISNRFFQDGGNMLEILHMQGKLRRVDTSDVIMTPTMSDEVPLDELNVLIAEQKGVTLDDLSIKSDMPHMQRKTDVKDVDIKDHTGNHSRVPEKEKAYPEILRESPSNLKLDKLQSAKDLRSEADRLYKEAAKLKKLAEELEPTKKKTSAKATKENSESERN